MEMSDAQVDSTSESAIGVVNCTDSVSTASITTVPELSMENED